MNFQGPGKGGFYLSQSKDTDAELFEAGRRHRSKGHCDSLIVATDGQGVRNYHQCNDVIGHGDATWHGCGDGETWHDVRRIARGPLTDVVFP